MFKQIGYGLAIWLLMLIITSAIIVMPGSALMGQILQIIVLGVLGYLAAFLYFKKTPGDYQAGLILGIIWVAIYAILDWVIIGIAAISGQGGITFSYAYTSWYLYVSFIVLLAATVLASHFTRGGELMIKKPATPQASPFNSQPKPQQPMANSNQSQQNQSK
ncbi:MAG: hypothetical protein JW816_03070 [Candidatus Buchananbacteria bacterium]|nr:hypothetical protein [Candidatus Buchananbacteria bacterium]